MSRLEIKADGGDVSADKMLKMASSALKLLRSIEIDQAKAAGRNPRKDRIRWRVDMMSGLDYGLIVIRGDPPKGARDTTIHQKTSLAIMREAMNRHSPAQGR